ncbi:MAG TPA: zinc-ribbon domain-containing protein [Myxococcota bacterium]
MIVTCEQCSTQFQLDDAKVPASGVRVRCSRCKHAFFIEPASADPELARSDLAEKVGLAAEAPPSPEAGGDLSEPDPDLQSDFEDSEDPSSESDWEFNQAPVGGDLSGESASETAAKHDFAREAIDDLLGSRPAPPAAAVSAGRSEPAAVAAPELGADDDELGSPESWDLLADDPPAAADSDSGAGLEQEVDGAPTRRDPASAARLAALAPRVEEWTPPSEPSVVLAWIARMAHTIGWSVTAILFSMVAILTLAPSLAPISEEEFGAQPVAGLDAQGISGRWVENAVSGALLVVSGRLVNPTAAPAALGTRFGVRLLDANGARLPGEPAALGPVILDWELREADPAGIQARQATGGLSLAAAVIQPGQSLPFEAVLADVPLAASRFVLEPLAPTRSAPLAAAADPAPGR